MKLFYDAPIVMFDVVDNRQASAVRAVASALLTDVNLQSRLPENRRVSAARMLRRIATSRRLEDWYHEFGFGYVLDSAGALDHFADEQFVALFSSQVLEHVAARDVAATLAEYRRVLSPGGCCIHQIGIDDHLTHYAPTASPKEYLRYSDAEWKRRFENRLQYFNRIQPSEWVNLFTDAGFEVVVDERELTELGHLVVHPQYSELRSEDVRCVQQLIVARKSS